MKKILIIFAGIVIFILIIIGITFLEGLKDVQKPKVDQAATDKSNNSSINTSINLKIDKQASDKLLEIVEKRPTPVLFSDKASKEKILAPLNNSSGIIFSNENYRLEYYKSPNSFEAKINTKNVASAKEEVIQYLKGRGLSEDGICKLPLLFTLSVDVSKYIISQRIEFSPIPSFCK